VTLCTSFTLLLYTHANRSMGIPDVAFIFLDDVILITMGQVLFVPLLTLVAMLCPKGLEGTVFCVYTALMNGGNQLSTLISAGLMSCFGITAHNFDNIVELRIVTLVLQLIPCLVIFLVPSDERMKEILEERDVADRETEHAAIADIIADTPEADRAEVGAEEKAIELAGDTTGGHLAEGENAVEPPPGCLPPGCLPPGCLAPAEQP